MNKKFLFFTSITDNSSLTCSLSSRILISDGRDLEEAKLNIVKRDRAVSLADLDSAKFVELKDDNASSIEFKMYMSTNTYIEEITSLYLREV